MYSAEFQESLKKVEANRAATVSYTHLTLPTKHPV